MNDGTYNFEDTLLDPKDGNKKNDHEEATVISNGNDADRTFDATVISNKNNGTVPPPLKNSDDRSRQALPPEIPDGNRRAGICYNYHYIDNEPCPRCLDRTVQRVGLTDPFVCDFCGHDLTPIEETPEETAFNGAPVQPTQKRRGLRLALVISAAVVAMAVIVVGAMLIFSAEDETSENTKATEQQDAAATDRPTELKLSYGTWEGPQKYGMPNGQGTMRFTVKRLVSQFDPRATVAQPGDYLIGDYDSGQLISGQLYRTDGSTVYISTVIPK